MNTSFRFKYVFTLAAMAMVLPLPFWMIPQDTPAEPANDLAHRVEKLETRVRELETILFANLQINLFEAERRVADAKQRVQASRELFYRGLLSEFQFQQDQFELDRAERELDLLRDPFSHRVAISELELRDAERRVEELRYRARFSESLLMRGYLTPNEIERLKESVATAEKQLELAREKLEATRRLNAIHPPESGENKDKP